MPVFAVYNVVGAPPPDLGIDTGDFWFDSRYMMIILYYILRIEDQIRRVDGTIRTEWKFDCPMSCWNCARPRYKLRNTPALAGRSGRGGRWPLRELRHGGLSGR